MSIDVNGAARELPDPPKLATLLAELGVGRRGSAVAVDGAVVPRGQWPDLVLRDGQTIEILTAVQGG
jgi:sulfur carrier protein